MARCDHVIDTRDFPRDWIENSLFPLARDMEKKSLAGNLEFPLEGTEMITIFFGESLRTRASFVIPMVRLGGKVIFESIDPRRLSSMAKGEPFEDMITVLNEYFDDPRRGVIILRHDEEGGAAAAAKVSDVTIVNAGDGKGQHPTQAFLDLYTIERHLGSIDGKSGVFMGDLDGSRTIHSLVYLFAKYRDVKVYLVSPRHLRIKADIKDYLARHNVPVQEVTDIRKVAHVADFVYQTRTQTNLGTKHWDRSDESNGLTIINKEVLNLMKPDSIICHPLPCNDEIVRNEVDDDPRAVYIKTKNGRASQVKCGLYIRMALLELILARHA